MKDYTQRGEHASTDYEDVQLDQAAAACPAQRSGLSSRQLARAATAGLAAPNAVLRDKEGRVRVNGKPEAQGDCCGMEGVPGSHDEVEEEAGGREGRRGEEVPCSWS